MLHRVWLKIAQRVIVAVTMFADVHAVERDQIHGQEKSKRPFFNEQERTIVSIFF